MKAPVAASLLLAAIIGSGPATDEATSTVRDLDWFELMPPWDDPEPGPPVGTHPAQPYSLTLDAVPELDGMQVRLPGFVVPLDSDEGGLLDEFLLVPFFGACIHVPPPPPNQLVLVRLAQPFYLKSMEDPYWVTGILRVQQWDGDFAEAFYMMEGVSMDAFVY